ncbi:hypothetical protein B0H15DRAFT_949291 [Mycena belliarum]|uniref:Uncharacterized protein n=1 Tax=Mycena belliarum TaxID=1033014 RepID=A0AAD6XUW3_9AGAR|nr:hypothetical protein B0H15DRAFT_949291 [Mycena belliae]
MPPDSPKPQKQRHRAQEQHSHLRESPKPSPQPNLGMSAEARYAHNLKVLRRRDPSIISIFDQFSHVCVYHHNGAAWEKNGFEGSMFLYERDSYPPYGFYILNRMGMDDYVQRLYPEDVTGIHGTYLMLRSYPDFTSRRLGAVYAAHDEAPEKFAEAYAVPGLDKLLDGDKGRANTVGLWMFPTDAREPMIDVMMRLHSYIKRNVPYPEQFCYGPNRPPPPNPHLRTTSPSPPPSPRNAPSGDGGLDRSFPSGSASELDKLFAKLRTDPAQPPAASSSPPQSGAKPAQAATMTVASLFASLTGAEAASENGNRPEAPVARSSSGIPLLDSIFASAGPATSPPLAHTPAVPLHAPTPQILNHEVITSLLGLPPARAASAAPSSSSHEGDNEYEHEEPGSDDGYQAECGGENGHNGARDGGHVSDGFSESSTVLDLEADEELQSAGASAGRPLLSVPVPPRHPPANGAVGARPNGNGKGRHGDVTPRVNGHPLPARHTPEVPAPTQAQAQFAAGEQLWAPVDDLEDGEIVELDFADTRALSDPEALRAATQQRRAAREGPSDGPVGGSGVDEVAHPRERKGRKKRRERERAAAVAGVAPADMEALRSAEAAFQQRNPSRPRYLEEGEIPSASGPRERQVEAERVLRILRDRKAGTGAYARAPSVSDRSISASPPPGQAVANYGRVQGSEPGVTNGGRGMDPGLARQAILTAVSALAQPERPRALERNEFIREVLTLIHTDKKFVDTLWKEYLDLL